ncbi:hypothetical protein EJ08DRAFT_695950 [Tothia fuscella]|uniref:Ima1 N-terminal domain-containing protein n=1 Tax=Tothia fuscella TaxID=1048955 RepID=A0A9P4U0C9_9PEZI|nr:hypothetical protein EJ08DRAFT_695950 [Tothia fuscella]
MPRFFRRNLTCFYCNTESQQQRKGKLRKWQCETCEAVNHLDENGDITEPPNTATPKAIRYANQPSRSFSYSPSSSPQDSTNLFCRICVQNHHFYNENLANFLPDDDDPQYPAYEAALPEYKAQLAERYPQVCADCAPKVNKSLRDATHMARSDHLQRMMDRTRSGRIKIKRGGWHVKHFIMIAIGVVWWVSLLSQVLWHVLAVLPTKSRRGLASDSTSTPPWCVVDALKAREVTSCCFNTFTSWTRYGLLLGAPVFWWNSKMYSKLSSRTGQLKGVGQYLALQFLVLILRFYAFSKLTHWTSLPGDIPLEAGHAVMIVLLLGTTAISLRIIELKEKPLVVFTGLQPIVGAPSTALPPPLDQTKHTHITSSFPISALAPPRRSPSVDPGYETGYSTSTTHSAISTTASTNEEDYDAEISMEWTPTNTPKMLEPRRPIQLPQHTQMQQLFSQPSPFYGTLPLPPVPPAHKARKPLAPFIPASQAKKDNFLNELMNSRNHNGGGNSANFGGQIRGDYTFAAPKMRDRQFEFAETGLEGLFNSAFSLQGPTANGNASGRGGDETEEGRGHVVEGREVERGMVVFWRLVFGLGVAGALGVGLSWWKGEGFGVAG